MTEKTYHDSQNYLPSTIWSVSDITSDDSGSIRSFLSRTTSKLESIEEGEENEEMIEMARRRRKRRTLKEYDCVQFKKGSIYISNLAQCQDSLAMPNTDDLEVGMSKDFLVLLDSTNQENADEVPTVQHSGSNSKAECQATSMKKALEEAKDNLKNSKMQASIPTGPLLPINAVDSERNETECESTGNANEEFKLPGDGEKMMASSIEVESDDSADEQDAILSVTRDDSLARDSTQTNSSVEDSAHKTLEHSANIMSDQQDGLQVDTSAVVSPKVGITPVTSNVHVVGVECMIDTGSPSIFIFDDSEMRRTETPVPCVQPLGGSSQPQDASFRHDEPSYEPNRLDTSLYSFDRENTSLYSLDMDETIVTIIDDIIAAIDDSKLLETTAEQSKTSDSNETTLDEIQTEKSNDSFFVDDQSASDIEGSGREDSMNNPSSSSIQSTRRFVLTDVTNSFLLDESKKKRNHLTSDEASDANTAYTF
ncbi:MAG: hypothetical protein SGBAC_002825 [Bacillariaceae sp.]